MTFGSVLSASLLAAALPVTPVLAAGPSPVEPSAPSASSVEWIGGVGEFTRWLEGHSFTPVRCPDWAPYLEDREYHPWYSLNIIPKGVEIRSTLPATANFKENLRDGRPAGIGDGWVLNVSHGANTVHVVLHCTT